MISLSSCFLSHSNSLHLPASSFCQNQFFQMSGTIIMTFSLCNHVQSGKWPQIGAVTDLSYRETNFRRRKTGLVIKVEEGKRVLDKKRRLCLPWIKNAAYQIASYIRPDSIRIFTKQNRTKWKEEINALLKLYVQQLKKGRAIEEEKIVWVENCVD